MEKKTQVAGLVQWGLVVVDLQNDFLAAGGYYARRRELDERVNQGTISAEARNRLLSQASAPPHGAFSYRDDSLAGIITNIAMVIERARAQQRPIAYLKAFYSRDNDVQPPSVWQDPTREHYPCRPHSWGAEFIKPIDQLIATRPSPSCEKVIVKHTLDGFYQTGLRQFLREKDIRTVVMVGVETHVCVLTTAQSAAINQFRTIILEDCIWSANEALGRGALAIFRDAFGSTAHCNLIC